MGIIDVDDMLAHLDGQKFDEWRLAYQMGLEPDAWRQTGEICSAITNQLHLLRYQLAQQKVNIDDLLPPRKFIHTEPLQD